MTNLGYYATTGMRWGGDPSDVAAWTDLDVYLWRQFDLAMDTPEEYESRLRDFRAAIKYSVKAKRKISLDLDAVYAPDTWPRLLKLASRRFVSMPLTNPWDSVAYIDVADEPTAPQARELARQVKENLMARKMYVPPVGATFSYQLIPMKMVALPELDWVGLEAYLDVRHQNSTLEIPRLVKEQLERQARHFVSGHHDVVVILQGYDRNGGWKNMESLAVLQRAGYQAAKDLFGDRLAAIKIFSWRRFGGTYYLSQKIRNQHKRIWNEISGS